MLRLVACIEVLKINKCEPLVNCDKDFDTP